MAGATSSPATLPSLPSQSPRPRLEKRGHVLIAKQSHGAATVAATPPEHRQPRAATPVLRRARSTADLRSLSPAPLLAERAERVLGETHEEHARLLADVRALTRLSAVACDGGWADTTAMPSVLDVRAIEKSAEAIVHEYSSGAFDEAHSETVELARLLGRLAERHDVRRRALSALMEEGVDRDAFQVRTRFRTRN